MPDVSVIIPIGPRHDKIAERAIESVKRQTVAVRLVTVKDVNGRGPGWARNRGVEACDTEWIAFVDADDELEPEFIAETLKAVEPYKDVYAYTDWYEDDDEAIVKVKQAPEPCKVWQFNNNFHLISALIPRAWFEHVGGFDETLVKGGEDREFWYRLTRAGCCGVRVGKPLAWYHEGGAKKRSQSLMRDEDEQKRLRDDLFKRYGGTMACCGQKTKKDTDHKGVLNVRYAKHTKPQKFVFNRGDREIEMVMDTYVRVKSRGRRTHTGRSTGYTYPRAGYDERLWVDGRDARAMSNVFEILPAPGEKLASIPKKTKRQVKAEQQEHDGLRKLAQASTNIVLPVAKAKPATTEPDFTGVIEKLQTAVRNDG